MSCSWRLYILCNRDELLASWMVCNIHSLHSSLSRVDHVFGVRFARVVPRMSQIEPTLDTTHRGFHLRCAALCSPILLGVGRMPWA